MTITADVDTLARNVEFDAPFRISNPRLPVGPQPGKSIVADLDTGVPGVHAPEVYHVEGASHPHDVEGFDRAEWEPLSGYTGQYSYNGAVMHASEYLGGGLARDVLSTPGVYVLTTVEVLEHDETCWGLSDDECSGGHEPAGWVILRHVGDVR